MRDFAATNRHLDEPTSEQTGVPASPRLLDRIGQPWVAEALGRSPLRWAIALLCGAALAWLAYDYPGGITGDTAAGAATRLAWSALLGVAPLIAVVDARLLIIPNRILLPTAGIVGVLLAADTVFGALTTGAALRALSGALVVGGYMFTIWFIAPSGGFGWGDVKLSALAGLVLATRSIWTAVVGVAILPALLSLIPMLILAARSGDGTQVKVPFGPFIAAGIVIAAFFGQDLALGV